MKTCISQGMNESRRKIEDWYFFFLFLMTGQSSRQEQNIFSGEKIKKFTNTGDDNYEETDYNIAVGSLHSR